MSDWTWDTQEAAAAWMVVPTGDAGLGLQVCLYLQRPGHPTSFSQLHSSQAVVLSLVANAVPFQGAPSSPSAVTETAPVTAAAAAAAAAAALFTP